MMVIGSTLKGMTGVTVKKLSPGEALVDLSGATKDSVIQAIEKAGYTVTNK